MSDVAGALPSLAQRLVAWQRLHGRHGFPWQHTQDPYRVWLSEIMLQQTQVRTVLDYYPRFLARFPDVASLAAAPLDEVFALWSGLGYYSRARNLHGCAQRVMTEWGGRFPPNTAQLVTLPGIGPSTAAAIAAFCFGERVSIFDGNVKRVLARHSGFAGDLAKSAALKTLQAQAQGLVPESSADMPTYTQALMDLGATVCLPRQPRCEVCPVNADCVARSEGNSLAYPVQTKKAKRGTERWFLLCLHNTHGDVWLAERPAKGIWAGLHAFPMFQSVAELLQAVGVTDADLRMDEPFLHMLTHKDLWLTPCWLAVDAAPAGLAGAWRAPASWARLLGLPKPVSALLQRHAERK